jgi:hypothetical protein
MALPDRPAHVDFLLHDLEDALRIDADRRILLEDGGQRTAALEPHLEALVVEPEEQAVHRPLGDADGQHAREAAPYRERLIRIDQRVGELANVFLRHSPQRIHRLFGDGVPRHERNHMRDDRSR